MKPTNYVSVSRVHTSIKESFLLDPGLYIPPTVHAALDWHSEREENLRLESTHGGVYADVAIVPGSKGRAKLWMKSTHGGVTAKIVRLFLFFLFLGTRADERFNDSAHPQTQTSTFPRPPSTSPSNPRMATCASTSHERSRAPSSSPSHTAL